MAKHIFDVEYPKGFDVTGSGSREEKAIAKFAEDMRGFFRPMVSDGGSLVTRVIGLHNGGFLIDVTAKDARKRDIAYMARKVHLSSKVVVNHYFVIYDPKLRGGKADFVNKATAELAESLGIEKIKVHAALEDGAHRWLRSGFWSKEAESQVRTAFASVSSIVRANCCTTAASMRVSPELRSMKRARRA